MPRRTRRRAIRRTRWTCRPRPGSNPLNGARFTDPGPYGGNYAAAAIAQLLGINPKSLPPTENWAQFQQRIESGPQQAKLNADPALAKHVNALAMIAGQPQAQRISTYSWGGTPSGIAKQTHKLFCQIAASDPGTVPLITTYFLHPNLGGCATTQQINAYMPRFKAQIDAMANATGRHSAVYLLETRRAWLLGLHVPERSATGMGGGIAI